MLTLACECEEGLGLPHTHVLKFGYWKTDVKPSNRNTFSVIEVEAEIDDSHGVWMGMPIRDQVKVCVDWRSVAQELMRASA
jgi:hypothetical protein